MQKVAQFLLLFAARGLAICAVLAGVGAGFLEARFGAGFVCMDNCPTRAVYFTGLGPTAVHVMTPCIVVGVLAVAAFLAYCVSTRQARRAGMPILFLLVGGLVGVAALGAFAQHGQATLSIWGGEEGDLLVETPLVSWAGLWGMALTLVAGAWSGVLAYLQWRR